MGVSNSGEGVSESGERVSGSEERVSDSSERVSGSEERVRLFVALELPAVIREALVDWRAPILREVHALRPVAREALHVTLCFLGSRRAGEVGPIGAAVTSAVRSHGGKALASISLCRGIWLPPRRPRLVAVELDDPDGGLGRIQASLSLSLQAGGWYEPEKRPFLAHVTVARVGRRDRLRAGALPALPAELAFEGARVTLYRSRLARAGARYEPLVSVAV